jgi:hypothetical protein
VTDLHDPKDADAAELPSAGAVTRLSHRYAESFPLRAAHQAIPYVGGSIDTMLAGLGSRWQYQRLQAFVALVDQRLRAVEGSTSIPEVSPSEPLYDFVMHVFEHVVRTRSEEKRRAFAAIVARQVLNPQSWDDAEAAAQLATDLSDVDIRVLVAAATSPKCGAPFDGLSVVTPSPQNVRRGAALLQSTLPGVPEHGIRLSCSRLLAAGLLHDEGVGRLQVGAFEYFVITDLGRWFLEWVQQAKAPSDG